MPAIIHLHRTENGVAQFLGANPRPRTPAEDQYHFTRLVAPRAVDLTKPKLLSDKDGKDHRIPITNQGQMGSCTAFTDQEINAWLSSFDTGTPVIIHAGWLYEQSRKKENGANNWQSDSGAYEADALDITMQGAPLAAAAPYIDQPGYDYSALDAQADPKNSSILRHMPFYPADGNVLENIWTAIDAGYPVAVAMAWLSPFFNPSGGMLPAGVNPADVAGGHEISCFGIVPQNGKLWVLCSNHWQASWSADAANFGFTMRPGDFAIPGDYFTMPNSIIWELRSVAPVAIAPQPDPNPQPQPNPQPTPAQNCTTPALGVVDGVLGTLKDAATTAPFSRPKHYRVEGAQQVRDAVASSGI